MVGAVGALSACCYVEEGAGQLIGGCGHRSGSTSQIVQEHAVFSLSCWIASPQSGQ